MDPEQLKFEVSSRYSPPRSTSPGGCSSWTSQPLWVPRCWGVEDVGHSGSVVVQQTVLVLRSVVFSTSM